MESITTPQVINKPFCANGDKNTIPSAATGSQLASLEEGFPEITEKPISQGGIPPERKDFNGAMNLNSQFYFAFQNGWWPTFETEVSTAIGGYPLGAVLWWFPEDGEYAGMAVPLKSLVANNTYNFNSNESYIGVYWKPLYKNPNALPIGTVFMHQSNSAADVPGALPLFTGETISNADQLYPEFYAWVADHSALQISAADYETALTTYGECPKYVIDTTNKTIRLPKLANYLKMANTTDGVTQAGAGLPNIYTEISSRKFQNGVGVIANVTGAGTFENDGYPAVSNVYTAENRSSSYSLQKSTVDASVGNSIYGNSNTVTPAHTTLFPWVCAYNAAVPASTAQAAQFQAALSSKADTDLGNCTKPYVTETYVNGESWYRIWSDGWCEQGNSKVPSSTSWETILLLKQYKDTNYQVIATNNGNINGTSSWSTVVDCQVYTRDSIQLKGAGADANWLISWKTCGYIR